MIVDRAMICSRLRELGVTSGDALLVHSSLRSFGSVDGGAEAVLDALLETVGDNGTVIVPTLTFSILKTKPHFFSVRKTPSTTGLITETLRRRREALRSRHPVSSAAAIGKHAAYVTADHRDTPCGPDSPYYRLYELGGKVVFFGASLGSNSVFHCAEEIVRPAYLGFANIENAIVEARDGRRETVAARRYDCFDRGVVRYLGNMEPIFLDRGILQRTVIGQSRTYVIEASANVAVSCEVLENNPDYILHAL